MPGFIKDSHQTGNSAESNFVDRTYFRLLAGGFVMDDSVDRVDNGTTTDSHSYKESPVWSRQDPMAQGYYDKFFVEERKLGRGQRGSVFYVQHILNGIPLGHFAVKIIPVGKSETWLVRMLKEVRLLEKLHHRNIVDYKHAWIENRTLTRFGKLY